MRIIQHSKYAGYSGTDKTAQLFTKHLVNAGHECYLLYRKGSNEERLKILQKEIGEQYIVGYDWIPGNRGKFSPYIPEFSNFQDVVREINPDIIHLHRAGIQEWPGFKEIFPAAKWVETNIFGYNDPSKFIDLNIYICEYIRQTALKNNNNDGPVLYNPIEQPSFLIDEANKETCRRFLLDKFNLPNDAVLLGRIGRPDNFDPISLRALKKLEEKYSNVYYIVVGACENWRRTVLELELQNVLFYESIIIDDIELYKFHYGIDIFAHARSDGEVTSTAIASSMMVGVPVVSHQSNVFNGHNEMLSGCGLIVPENDYNAYFECLDYFIDNIDDREYFGQLSREKALEKFDARVVGDGLQTIYTDFLA